MTLTIHHGDCLEILPTLAPLSIQTIVTSPPYLGLRDYGIAPTAWPAIEYAPMPGLPPITIPAQTVCLGLEADPLAYAAHMVHVFRLARPALRDDGTAWLNLGDAYYHTKASGPQGKAGQRTSRTFTAAGAGGQHVQVYDSAKKSTGLKDKDLIMIPARVALALQADGWYVRNQAIWWKPNATPESVKDRLTVDYEPLYLLAKSPRYYFDAAAIAEPSANSTRPQYRRACELFNQSALTPAHLAAIRAVGTNDAGKSQKTQTGYGKNAPETQRLADEAKTALGGYYREFLTADTVNRRTVWRIPTEALRDEHYAPMPEALVEPCILAGSKPGDTALDMFFGSGTVGRVALRYGRSCIGIDKNDAYVDMSERRTNSVQVHMEALL